MPTYSYTSRTGETIERHYPMGSQPPTIRVKGRRYARNPVADHACVMATPGVTGEFECEALAVHPMQVREANADARRRGLKGVRFDPVSGNAIFDNHRSAYTDYKLAYGFHDKQAGYSGVAPEDVRRHRERRGEAPRDDAA